MDKSLYSTVYILQFNNCQFVIPCKYPIILSNQKVKNDKLDISVRNN